MQTMSTAMATLLKSGKMIGANRPTAEVQIGSGGDTYNWTNPSALRLPKGRGEQDYHPSVVKLEDGRLLFMYARSGSLYQAYVSQSVDYILGNDDFITTEEVVLSGMSNPRATVFQTPTGDLFFIIAYTAKDSEIVAKVEIYKSDLKDGSDWSLYKLVASMNHDNNYVYNSAERVEIGAPYFTESGRWIIPGVNWAGSGLSAVVGIWVSDDYGLTFTRTYEYESSTSLNSYDRSQSRQVVEYDGKLWTAWTSGSGTGSFRLLSSIDNGSTWVQVLSYDFGQMDNNTNYFDPVLSSDKNGLYWISGDNPGETPLRIYKMSKTMPEDTALANFEYTGTISNTDGLYGHANLFTTELDNKLILLSGSRYDKLSDGTTPEGLELSGIDIIGGVIQAKSITINRSKGMAGGLTLELDNKSAILAPDGTANPQLLWPNKEVIVKQGYGAELLKTFTGLIDSISMSRDEQGVASVTVSARDKLKVALDHLIRNQDFLYTLTYTNMLVEDIWKNLVGLAGLTYNTVEATGLTISSKTFSWETYADAFSWLDEIAGFETYCDEEGLLNFVWDGRPATITTAYSFIEGVDITRLGYEINDQDLFYTVAVYGKLPADPEVEGSQDSVIYFAKQLPQASYWNIPSGKVLRIDAPDADTQAKCEIIADKAIYLMQTRARQVTFSTIGIPHLQRGDFIQVEESSTTISEIYRITDITTQQGPDGYGMTLTCYYHAAPEVV